MLNIQHNSVFKGIFKSFMYHETFYIAHTQNCSEKESNGRILNAPFFACWSCTSIAHVDSKHWGIYKISTPFLKAETGKLHWASFCSLTQYTEAASYKYSCREALLSDCLASLFIDNLSSLCPLQKGLGWESSEYQSATTFPPHIYQLVPILLLSALPFAFPAHDKALYVTPSLSTRSVSPRACRAVEESIRSRALGYLGWNTNFSAYSLAVGPWASYLCSVTIHVSEDCSYEDQGSKWHLARGLDILN